MIVFFCGDSHGEIRDLNERVERMASKVGPPDWVIHVGSFGCWPDPKHTDRATRERKVLTDFHELYLKGEGMPYPTLFCPGKHEDHRWLQSMYQKGYFELIPNLHRMPNGFSRVLELKGWKMSVLTMGGVFSPLVYKGERRKKKGYGYFTKRDVEKASSVGPADLLITAEAGYGARLGGIVSQAPGINTVCFATRPRLHVHGSYNVSKRYINPITETTTLSLANKEVQPWAWDNVKFNRLAWDL